MHWGLPCQSYDGGANMSGIKNGVQAHSSKLQPLAIYTHCMRQPPTKFSFMWCLLAVVAVRNTIGDISVVSTYVHNSVQRMKVLEDRMGEDYSKISKMRIEKHTTVLKFMEVLPYLPEVLKVLNKKESRSGDPAFSLLASIQNSEFLVSLVVLNKIKGISLPFARKLQGKELDLLQALQLIEAVKLSNSEMRNSPDEFPILFKAAQSLANTQQRTRY